MSNLALTIHDNYLEDEIVFEASKSLLKAVDVQPLRTYNKNELASVDDTIVSTVENIHDLESEAMSGKVEEESNIFMYCFIVAGILWVIQIFIPSPTKRKKNTKGS